MPMMTNWGLRSRFHGDPIGPVPSWRLRQGVKCGSPSLSPSFLSFSVLGHIPSLSPSLLPNYMIWLEALPKPSSNFAVTTLSQAPCPLPTAKTINSYFFRYPICRDLPSYWKIPHLGTPATANPFSSSLVNNFHRILLFLEYSANSSDWPCNELKNWCFPCQLSHRRII